MFIHQLFHARQLIPSIFRHHTMSSTHSGDKGPPHSEALKIVHAGGKVEYYYMALSASTIIDKHPSYLLARPDVFRRPWDSVIRPEEILVPGERYYVVPRRTVKILRRRIARYSTIGPRRSSGEYCSRGSFCDHTSASIMCIAGDKSVNSSDLAIMEGRRGGSGRRRRALKMVAWQPELAMISESSAVYD